MKDSGNDMVGLPSSSGGNIGMGGGLNGPTKLQFVSVESVLRRGSIGSEVSGSPELQIEASSPITTAAAARRLGRAESMDDTFVSKPRHSSGRRTTPDCDGSRAPPMFPGSTKVVPLASPDGDSDTNVASSQFISDREDLEGEPTTPAAVGAAEDVRSARGHLAAASARGLPSPSR